MAESVFEAVKQSITVREAAQMYGIEVNRSGMACCPFHDDKNPSMKLNEEYFYCFGCGATGDVIDFAVRLYNLSPREAAEKLAQDFGLAYDSQAPPRRRYVRQKTEAQKFKEDRDHAFRVLADYFHLLRKWETDYTPKTPEENPDPRFMEAIQKKDYVGYLLDFFLEDTPDEQKLWIAEHQLEIAKLERRVKFMADKPTNRERLQEITAGIEQGIKELFESERYRQYLSTMSRFHHYSVNNTMLIYMQRPDATLVAGFNKWKNQFERHVKKGEHGITIIAPTPYKKKIEEMKRDPDTHAPILDADGKAVMEEKEIEIPMFRPVKVFDVSQTDGKPLPELASSLSGTVPHYEAFLEALRRSAPVPIEFEPMAANMDGYFSSEQQRIAIREGMSEVQIVSAAVHETAHSKLHDPKKHEAEPTWKIVMVSEGGTKKDYRLDFATEAEAEQVAAEDGWRYVDENQFEWSLEVEEDLTAVKQAAKNRNTEEVEAESISYAVCQYFGIQTGENSFGYIASWSEGKELKELRASLETINKTSCELIRYEEIFIADYDGDLSELNACLGEYESIDELNHLACLLSELDKSDLEKFEAVVASGEHTSGAGDLINLAENLDCYDFYIGVSDDETLGRIYAEDMEMIDIPENLRNYFDYEAYGRDMRINEDGSFVKGGFLLPNGSQFIEYYHGREDIPTNTRFLPIHSSPSGNRWQLIKKSLTVFPRRRNAHTRSKAIQTDSGTSGHFVQRCFFLEGRDLAGR